MDIRIQKLINHEYMKKVEGAIQEIVDFDMQIDGLRLVKIIEEIFSENKDFENQYPDYYKIYKIHLLKAKFIALPLLTRREILNLLDHYFIFVLKLPDYNLIKKIKEKAFSIYDLNERDKFKEKIRNSMLKNETQITKNDLVVGFDNLKPTVANWLKDYNLKLGTNLIDKLKYTQYFSNSENIKGLSQEEKIRVEKVLVIYEKLKLSSKSIEGLEESFVAILPNGEINTITGGIPEKIDPRIVKIYEKIKKSQSNITEDSLTAKINRYKQMALEYSENSLERKAILEEIRRLEGLARRTDR